MKGIVKAAQLIAETVENYPAATKEQLRHKTSSVLGDKQSWEVKTAWGPVSGNRLAMLHLIDGVAAERLVVWSKQLGRAVDLNAIRPHKTTAPVCWASMIQHLPARSAEQSWGPILEIWTGGKFGAKNIKTAADLIQYGQEGGAVVSQLLKEILARNHPEAILKEK